MKYEERRKQIQQREEEIVELMEMDSNARKHIINRILALLESALVDLRKGMRA